MTVVLDARSPAPTVLTVIDVVGSRRTATLRAAETVTSGWHGRPGFLGASWLTRCAEGPGSDPVGGPYRAIEILQWDHQPEAGEPAVSVAGQGSCQVYDTVDVVTADNHGRVVLARRSPAAVTGVLFLDPVGSRDRVVEVNTTDTREFIQDLEGFVSASFLLSRSSDRLVEIVQWASAEHLSAAFEEPRFRRHGRQVEEMATVDFGLYEIWLGNSAETAPDHTGEEPAP